MALLRAGCGQSPISPNPLPTSSPSPSPAPSPVGKPNATALENLPLVRSLEQATGRGGLLITINGTAKAQDGIPRPGSLWDYVFAQVNATGLPRLYYWTVYSDGTIEFTDDAANVGRQTYVDIGPSLAIDSPEAVRRGQDYGAKPFVDRYPGTLVAMVARSVAGRVIWQMRFFDLSPEDPLCSVEVTIDALTGELLLRDLSCLNRIGALS